MRCLSDVQQVFGYALYVAQMGAPGAPNATADKIKVDTHRTRWWPMDPPAMARFECGRSTTAGLHNPIDTLPIQLEEGSAFANYIL